MNKLQQLIQELCPNGVEFKTLGEIGFFYGGLTGKSKDDFKDGNAKFITYMNIYKNLALALDINDTVKVAENEKQNQVLFGDVLFTGSSETPDECGMSSVVTKHTEEKLYLNSFCFGFRLNDVSLFESNFLKHLFRSNELRKQIALTASGVTRFNVSKARFAKISIPVPPLAIQNEIASILDKFSTLTAELQAELQARKSQYEYYRNQLLDYPMEESDQPSLRSSQSATSIKNNDNLSQQTSKLNPRTDNSVLQPRGKVEWKKLGEIIKFLNGRAYKQSELLEDGKYKVLRVGNFHTNDKWYYSDLELDDDKYCNEGDLLYTWAATLGPQIWYGQKVIFHYHIWKLVFDENILNKRFLYYFLQMDVDNISESLTNSTMPHISMASMNKRMVPIPPLAEQECIVTILDKFDTLTNSITEGLPKEIELRQKQYEYYRDMLLTFPRVNA